MLGLEGSALGPLRFALGQQDFLDTNLQNRCIGGLNQCEAPT